MLQYPWIRSADLKSWARSLKFNSLNFYLHDSVKEGLHIVKFMVRPNCNKELEAASNLIYTACVIIKYMCRQ
jgi:hypothetical protein